MQLFCVPVGGLSGSYGGVSGNVFAEYAYFEFCVVSGD
jgi:hypothetical protein